MADAVILERVLGHIHNWFERESITVSGCQVSDGSLPESVSSRIPTGAWYRIVGSYLNDGMHLRGDESEGLTDETFDGTITVCSVPKPLLAVVEEIGAWVSATSEASSKALSSPYQSESFGGYSYTMRDVGGSSGSASGGWQDAFASDLNQWRKVS